jgi:hypothetical protein
MKNLRILQILTVLVPDQSGITGHIPVSSAYASVYADDILIRMNIGISR